MQSRIIQLGASIMGALVAYAFAPGGAGNQGSLLTPEQREILSHQSLVFLDDGQGGRTETIRFEGVNVQIVNGLGATNGVPLDPFSIDELVTVTNGLGNLTIGYNETGGFAGGFSGRRTGSHNVISGLYNRYASFGGAVFGSADNSGAPFATLMGGTQGDADGPHASIAGGYRNVASGDYSMALGGSNGQAAGLGATIAGGMSNQAAFDYVSIRGGTFNLATSIYGTVLGGEFNSAAGMFATCGGGYSNNSGGTSSTGGGANNTAESSSSIAGGLLNSNTTSNHISISGGQSNHIGFAGDMGWIGGGKSNLVEGNTNILQGFFTFAPHAAVMGGFANWALSDTSTVSGGASVLIQGGTYSWRAGSLIEAQ